MALVSDDVVFATEPFGAEAFDGEPGHIDRRDASEDEVAHHLADRRAEKEPVTREAGRVEEAGQVGRLADDRVVVRRGLVETSPTAGDADVEQARRATH